MLAELGDGAKVLAGGQSLVPMISLRLAYFDHLVDIGRIDVLRGIARDADAIVIGAATVDAAVEHDPDVAARVPLLARATPLIGHFQIRNRGTLGGSIAHADPAAEYPAIALALDAELEAVSPRGTRRIPAAEFFDGLLDDHAGAGRVARRVCGFRRGAGARGFAIREFARRFGDFAIAGAVVAVQLDADDRVARCAIGLLGLGPTPLRATAAEKAVRWASRLDFSGRRARTAGTLRADRGSVRPARVGVVSAARRRRDGDPGLARSDRGGDAWLRAWCGVAVNGESKEAQRRGSHHARRLPPREQCGLTGTHLGCEHGVCGACTVLVDGAAVRSCLMFAVQADGAGSDDDRGHHRAGRRAEPRAGGVPRGTRPAVRVLHARLRRIGDCVPSRLSRIRPTARSKKRCRGTCAAAPAIRASSTRCGSRPRPEPSVTARGALRRSTRRAPRRRSLPDRPRAIRR